MEVRGQKYEGEDIKFVQLSPFALRPPTSAL